MDVAGMEGRTELEAVSQASSLCFIRGTSDRPVESSCAGVWNAIDAFSTATHERASMKLCGGCC